MNQGRLRAVLAAAALTALLVLPGCIVIDPADPPSWLPAGLIPTATPAPSTEGTVHPAPSKDKKRTDVWQAYFVGKGRLRGADRSGKPANLTPAKAMEQLLAGPSTAERKAGLTTAIPKGTQVREVTIDFASTARLDLTGEFASGGSGASVKMRVAQVVYTLTQIPGVTGVLIRVEGQPIQHFGRERIDLLRPQNRGDFADVAR